MISESGLKRAEDLRHLQTLGFHGFLIGEALNAREPILSGLARFHRRDNRQIAEMTTTSRRTNDRKIVGRLCQTPWRFTETPYNF